MTAPWWQTAVVYQIYPRSFFDSNHDGVGDLTGIRRKLPYLSDLGVDAIWLSPFYRSPMADFGYDVADHCDVDPTFGTLADFGRLVATAHAEGLKVIVDFVPNHTSDHHAWFSDSRASKSSGKRDWYVWRDPAPGGGPPNNWLSVFGGSAWEWDAGTDQYYLHSFLKEQPDLNWRNADVRDAMFDVLRFWMDRGVDGFRIDVAHAIMKDPEERDNPLSTGAQQAHKSLGEYDSQIHMYDKGHPDVLDVFADLRKLVDTYGDARDRVAIGEIHEFDLDAWTSYFGADSNGLHMPFNFALMKAPWTAQGVRDHVCAIEAAIPANGWPNYVLGNHDEARLASKYGPDSTRLAAVLLLTLRGTPFLYYGDELGMTETPIAEYEQQDPWGIRVPGLGRDGCRTPMQWTGGPAAGFTSAKPWLPIGDNSNRRNVAVQEDEPGSLLNLYKRLLLLRRTTPALQRGAFRMVDGGSDQCFCFEREDRVAPGPKSRIFVALNFGDETEMVILPGKGRIILWSHRPGEELDLIDTVMLGPKEAAVAVLF